MPKRLRVSQVLVQPVLVWDDGETLTPGPQVDPVTLSQADLAGWVEGLGDQLIGLQEQLEPTESEQEPGEN